MLQLKILILISDVFLISYRINFEDRYVRSQSVQKTFGDFDSKFKFVIVAAKRAKQLLKGAKPKLKTKSKSLIRIAQEEVKDGLVNYEVVHKKKEEEHRAEDEDFIGEDIVGEVEAIKQVIKKKTAKTRKTQKAKGKKEKK